MKVDNTKVMASHEAVPGHIWQQIVFGQHERVILNRQLVRLVTEIDRIGPGDVVSFW